MAAPDPFFTHRAEVLSAQNGFVRPFGPRRLLIYFLVQYKWLDVVVIVVNEGWDAAAENAVLAVYPSS